MVRENLYRRDHGRAAKEMWITSALEQWEQRYKITREFMKYECDPKLQM